MDQCLIQDTVTHLSCCFPPKYTPDSDHEICTHQTRQQDEAYFDTYVFVGVGIIRNGLLDEFTYFVMCMFPQPVAKKSID